jgi:RNA polymerase sigma factor (TIGR02999 family)
VEQSATQDFAQLLAAWNAGEPGSDERLFACIYGELHRLAAYHHRREEPGHTLQTTALANEAYLRLSGKKRATGKDRGHFCAIASRAMRQILVDHARRRKSAKRGGGLADSPLDSIVLAVADAVDLVELDIALEKLRRLDPREASIVELRFFAGLTVPEIAQALGVSRATVERDWAAARAWLHRELATGGSALD